MGIRVCFKRCLKDSVLVLSVGFVASAMLPLTPRDDLVEMLLDKSSRSPVSVLIDYDYPIHMRRLWVIARKDGYRHDGKTYRRGGVVMNTWVSHALRSGLITATYFSNVKDSMLSSRGLMKTHLQTHDSRRHGAPALRVDGLSPQLNSAVRKRHIIFHKSYSPVSAGCFQSLPFINERLTKLIAGGSLLYVHKSNAIDVKRPPRFIDWRSYFDALDSS